MEHKIQVAAERAIGHQTTIKRWKRANAFAISMVTDGAMADDQHQGVQPVETFGDLGHRRLKIECIDRRAARKVIDRMSNICQQQATTC
ncbi:hypothetical protein CPC16_006365 [Podila verticillata]|nr:hypothetical protein CPC16_006365 [Podila verticillata]